MKKLLLAVAIMSSGCVAADEAASYAKRAHPECSEFSVLGHSYSGGKDGNSLTEVSMTCSGAKKSLNIKCSFGFGIISDTICFENN